MTWHQYFDILSFGIAFGFGVGLIVGAIAVFWMIL